MARRASSLPSPELERRVAKARSELAADAVEWTRDGDEGLSATTSAVLCVDSLPDGDAEVMAVLERWKRVLPLDAELRLIERTRRESAGLGSLLPTRHHPYRRDLVAAIRAVGWVITAIDRLDVTVDGSKQRWVDLHATDLREQVARELA